LIELLFLSLLVFSSQYNNGNDRLLHLFHFIKYGRKEKLMVMVAPLTEINPMKMYTFSTQVHNIL